jgi:hypothetical protein
MRKPESIANLVTIALGVFVVYHSYYTLKLGILISPGAGFLPFLCGVALIILGAVWRFQAVLFKPVKHAAGLSPASAETAADPLPVSRVKLGLAFATTVAYACLWAGVCDHRCLCLPVRTHRLFCRHAGVHAGVAAGGGKRALVEGGRHNGGERRRHVYPFQVSAARRIAVQSVVCVRRIP